MKLIFLFFFMYSVNSFSYNINIGLPVDLNIVDPYNLNLLEEYEVFSSVYDSLIFRDAAKGYESSIAEKWEFDKNKKTVTFYLRKDLKFSDGSILNAEDVEATLKRLILLDKDKSLLISKCLETRKKNFSNFKSKHPLITVKDLNSIQIGPTDCGETIFKEIGDTNYGIISKNHIQSNLELFPNSPTSGAFVFLKKSNGFQLVPNIYNWRWAAAQEKEINLSFIKIDQDFSSVSHNKINVFRTSSNKIMDEATQHGFQNIVSVPIMLWYLTSDNLKSSLDIINLINQNNKQIQQFQVFKNNNLETPAEFFFPPEFNCKGNKDLKMHQKKQSATKTIRILNHKSHESDIYVSDLKKLLTNLGYQVIIDNQGSASKSGTINLYLKRQFYGDGIEGTLNFTFQVIKSIPDPSNKIGTLLEKLSNDNQSNESKKNILNKICNEVHFYNHSPIAHRKYAFLYNSDKYKEIFSKGSGNLIFNRLIK